MKEERSTEGRVESHIADEKESRLSCATMMREMVENKVERNKLYQTSGGVYRGRW
jgi:hypothetical protein